MSDKYKEMLDFLISLEPDIIKFYDKKQQAAGVRLRKAMSELKDMAQEIRVEIQEIKSLQEKNKIVS